MNFIHTIPKAYSKKSCAQLISWFEKNIDKAEPGTAGKLKLKDLEIAMTLKDEKDYFNLGKTIIEPFGNISLHCILCFDSSLICGS